ncbi:MAG: PEP-CTERM sorting domain-containing protein [Planctomycetota bacterium]
MKLISDFLFAKQTHTPVKRMRSNILQLRSYVLLMSLAFGLVAKTSSYGAVIYSEPGMGDLSGTGATPTDLTGLLLVPGMNSISGNVGSNGNTGAVGGSDADYFSITLSAGQTIDSLTVDSYTLGGAPSADRAFFGYRQGAGFAGQSGADIDDSVLFSSTNDEILLATTGLSELNEGTHSFWLQQTSPGVFDYTLTFNVTAIPEPSSLFAICAIGSVYAVRRQKRSR